MNKFRPIALSLMVLSLAPLTALVQQKKELPANGNSDVRQQVEQAEKPGKKAPSENATTFMRPSFQRRTEVKNVPYEATFPTAASVEEYTIIDANNDNTTFKWENAKGGRLRISYNTALDMDDWVILPGLQLQAGKMYKVIVGTQTVDSGLERFDVRFGTSPTAEAMTTTIIGMTEFNSGSNNINEYTESFTVPADGVYYIGYHGCSLKDQYYLHLNYVKVEADASGSSPRPVSDFKVTVDETNGLKANISMTAPTHSKLGEPLESLDKVELRRNDSILIHTFTGITPGQQLSYTDLVEEEGNYTYSATPYVGNEAGASVQASIYLKSDITLPYDEYFNTQADFDAYTVIDNNHDGQVFKWNKSKYAQIQYNRNMPMDDWLITPRIWLETGKTYEFEVYTASSHSTEIEKFEVKIGRQPTVEGMTTGLIPVTEHQGQSFTQHSQEFTVQETGWHYIGIHGCSDADKYYLLIDNISVSAGIDNSLPGDIPYLNVSSNPTGGHIANIAFKVPEVTYGGQPLSKIDKIEVSRNDSVIAQILNPTLGDTIRLQDNTGSKYGYLMYAVTAYNAAGAGNKKSTVAWVGATYPYVVENVAMSETTTPGLVTASWDPVTKTYNGEAFLDPSHITYRIVNYALDNEPIIADDIVGTTWTDTVVEEGNQDFLLYGFYAVSERGTSRRVSTSPLLAVGTPYSMPYLESYANGTTSHIIGMRRTGGSDAQWYMAKDNTFKGITSYDNDNGFVYLKATELDGSALFFTGKIDLTQAINPGLMFRTYNIASSTDPNVKDINQIRIYVKEANAEEWNAPIVTTTVDAACNGVQEAWGKFTTGLAAFKGKVVQIGIEAVTKQFTYTLLDCIEIAELPEHNLVAEGISAPRRVSPNEPFDINVTVLNRGIADVSGATVDLYETTESGDSLITRMDNLAIPMGNRVTYKFPITFSPCHEPAHTYYAHISHASDLVEEDNKTASTTVNLQLSTIPAPTDLIVKNNSSKKPYLKWTAPEVGAIPDAITEDFENWTPFLSDSLQHGWTMVDVDGKPLGTISNMSLPITKGSFFVFDKEQSGGNNTFYGYNQSNRYLASLYRADDGLTDDWAISPELSGRAQTIHFYAKSYSASYSEKMQVFYSTTLPQPDAMTACSDIYTLPNTWQEIEVSLPAGAKYFGIRSSSLGAYMLMIDDVTYEPMFAPGSPVKKNNLTVTGYNIYRDRVKINNTPVTDTRYEDFDASISHIYHVTALLNDGRETAASSPAKYDVSTFAGTPNANAVQISVDGRFIIVGNVGNKRVIITTPGGITLHDNIGDTRIAVERGIYLVNAGGKTTKLIVK